MGRDESAEYYNLFSEWREHELLEYLHEHGQKAPRNTPLELLRAQCADIAEEDARRRRQARAQVASRQIAAPIVGPDNRKRVRGAVLQDADDLDVSLADSLTQSELCYLSIRHSYAGSTILARGCS